MTLDGLTVSAASAERIAAAIGATPGTLGEVWPGWLAATLAAYVQASETRAAVDAAVIEARAAAVAPLDLEPSAG